MVHFWSDPRDIKLAILETLAELSRREDLVGWIPGNESVDTSSLAEELARFAKENAVLRRQAESVGVSPRIYNSLTYDEMYKLLDSQILNEIQLELDHYEDTNKNDEALQKIASIFGSSTINLIHYFLLYSRRLQDYICEGNISRSFALKLREIGVIERQVSKSTAGYTSDYWNYEYLLTEAGKQFLLRLRLEHDLKDMEKYIL
jgi:hypothetical protein